jgi:hypothetical protein
MIALWIFSTCHLGLTIALYIAVCAIISLISVEFMTDYTGKDISREYDEGA